jgi:hypothetical protein
LTPVKMIFAVVKFFLVCTFGSDILVHSAMINEYHILKDHVGADECLSDCHDASS